MCCARMLRNLTSPERSIRAWPSSLAVQVLRCWLIEAVSLTLSIGRLVAVSTTSMSRSLSGGKSGSGLVLWATATAARGLSVPTAVARARAASASRPAAPAGDGEAVAGGVEDGADAVFEVGAGGHGDGGERRGAVDGP